MLHRQKLPREQPAGRPCCDSEILDPFPGTLPTRNPVHNHLVFSQTSVTCTGFLLDRHASLKALGKNVQNVLTGFPDFPAMCVVRRYI